MLHSHRSVLPTVHPPAFVDVSAQVIGDVHIDSDVRYRLEFQAEQTPA